MRRRRVALFFLIVLIFFSGCATVNTLDKTRRRYPEKIKASVFSYSAIFVFQALEVTLKDLDLEIYLKDKTTGRIYVRSRDGLLSGIGFGEKIGIYIIPINRYYTKVEIVAQKACYLDLRYRDWRREILKGIGKYLRVVLKR